MVNSMLQVKNLVKYFPIKKGVFRKTVGWIKAVDDISFEIYEGETLGLVGESGCGKTTTALTILRLEEPTKGQIIFDGKDITRINKSDMRKERKNMVLEELNLYEKVTFKLLQALHKCNKKLIWYNNY